jgi:hypothetical protein
MKGVNLKDEASCTELLYTQPHLYREGALQWQMIKCLVD